MEGKLARTLRFFLLAVPVALFTFLGSCAYITGESTATTRLMPRWSWSLAENGNTIIIDRQTGKPIRDITAEEAFGVIGTSSRSDYPVLIDVRTPQEYAEGHIRDAINIDYNSSSFKNGIDVLDKDKLHVVYCRSGRRSAAARDIMEELGFKYVINVTGGFSVWIAAGLPVAE